jgi:streptomycin 6-kinase
MGDGFLVEPAKDMVQRRSQWESTLPRQIEEAFRRWDLDCGIEVLHEAPTASWVAPVLWNDKHVVLKIPFPHFEGLDEALGLKFWEGDPTVKLLASDESSGAMLLEHCLPGTVLRQQPETAQDEVIANLLNRLWLRSADGADLSAFRTLTSMLETWYEEASLKKEGEADRALFSEGFELLLDLERSSPSGVLLATDLHAGNVLRHGETWRIIDPKPFVGDRTFDLVQHILNCRERLISDPIALIGRLAELAQLGSERLRLYLFGRLAITTGSWAEEEGLKNVIRTIAP